MSFADEGTTFILILPHARQRSRCRQERRSLLFLYADFMRFPLENSRSAMPGIDSVLGDVLALLERGWLSTVALTIIYKSFSVLELLACIRVAERYLDRNRMGNSPAIDIWAIDLFSRNEFVPEMMRNP